MLLAQAEKQNHESGSVEAEFAPREGQSHPFFRRHAPQASRRTRITPNQVREERDRYAPKLAAKIW